jgi:hypothetical protein
LQITDFDSKPAQTQSIFANATGSPTANMTQPKMYLDIVKECDK